MANFQNGSAPFSHPIPFPPYQPFQAPPPAQDQMTSQDSQTTAAYQFNGTIPIPNLGAIGTATAQFPPFWHAFQNGAFPAVPPPFLGPNGEPIPPPFLPGLNFNTPQAIPAAPLMSPRNALAPSMPSVGGDVNRITEIIDVDKEEGELSDADNLSSSSRAIQQDSIQVDDKVNGELTATKTGSQSTGSPHRSTEALSKIAPSKMSREDAKTFLNILNRGNVALSVLLKEGLDSEILKELWHEARLPMQPDDNITQPGHPVAQSPAVADSKSSIENASSSSRPTEFVKKEAVLASTGQIITPETKLDQPSPTAVMSKTLIRPTSTKPATTAGSDRSEYIARLMAARGNKSALKPSQQAPSPVPSPVEEPAPKVPAAQKGLIEDNQHALPQVSKQPRNANAQTSALMPTDPSQPPIQALQPTSAKSLYSQEDVDAQKRKTLQNELLKKRIADLQASSAAKAAPAPSIPSATNASKRATHTPSPGLDRSESPLYSEDEVQSAALRSNGRRMIESTALVANDASRDGLSTPNSEPHQIPGLRSAVMTEHSSGLGRRKRPVASDFDDIQNSSPASKRPFGRPKPAHETEEMIIQVSDDEDDGTAMELDNDVNTSLSQLIRNVSHTPQTTPKPAMNSSNPSLPRSGMSTPSVHDLTPGSGSSTRLPELSAHTKQIEYLKKRIAIAELKRKAKEAINQVSSKSANHILPRHSHEESQESNITTFDSIATSPGHSSKSAFGPPVQAVVQTPVSAKSDVTDPDTRARRRAELESGIQLRKTARAQNRERIQSLQQQLDALRANSKLEDETTEQLEKELESIGVETAGIPLEEIQAAKQAIPEKQPERDHSTGSTEAHANSSAFESKQIRSQGDVSAGEESDLYNDSPSPREDDNKGDSVVAVETAAETRDNDSASYTADLDAYSPVQSPTSTVEVKKNLQADSSQSVSAPLPVNAIDLTMEVDADEYEPVPLLDAEAPPEVASHNLNPESGASVKDDSDDDFYSPEPTQQEDLEGKPETADIATGDLSDDYLEELSPVSGEGHEEDTAMIESEGSEYDPIETVQAQLAADITAGESYEAEQPTALATELSDVSDVSTPSSSASGGSEVSSSDADEVLPETADNLATDLQAEREGPLSHSVADAPVDLPAAESPANPSRFQPYESPLRIFREYRYHPDYSNSVPGGFRSMTFSHQIDPQVPLCPFEGSGGTCNDAGCTNQHFRSMELSDSMLLCQLGTKNPGRTEDEKKQWTEGLRAVLKELRAQNTNDPEVIATAIANYRREFLKDPIRILSI